MTSRREPKNINNALKAFQFVLKKEVGDKKNGGYTDDPNDPGGETKYGISKKFNPDVDVKNLTPESALYIYLDRYWFPAGCDDLPYPECLVVMDTAIQCGVSRAKQWLKDTASIDDYIAERRRFHLQTATDQLWARKYIGGWMNRCTDLQRIVDLAGKE